MSHWCKQFNMEKRARVRPQSDVNKGQMHMTESTKRWVLNTKKNGCAAAVKQEVLTEGTFRNELPNDSLRLCGDRSTLFTIVCSRVRKTI